jgi:hypothetical protein
MENRVTNPRPHSDPPTLRDLAALVELAQALGAPEHATLWHNAENVEGGECRLSLRWTT